MSARRRRRTRGSASQDSVIIEDSPITVDLCITTASDAGGLPSCIDLTRDDEDVIELTLANDSVVCLDAGPSTMQTRRQRLRQCRRTAQSVAATPEKAANTTIVLDSSLSEDTAHAIWDDNETSPRKKIICSVCLDDETTITRTNRQLVSTICGHVFCNVCIHESIRNHHGCPNCRKKLTLKQFHPIFI